MLPLADALSWSSRLVALSVALQTIELLSLRRAFAPGAPLAGLAKGGVPLLALQLALCGWVAISGASLLSLALFMSYGLLSARLGAPFNGGSDAMTSLSLLMLGVLVLYTPIAPLTEALNSPWLVIHVVAAIIATAAFTLGGVSSVLYLLKTRENASSTGYLARVPEPADLDRLSYRLHAFAFPIWTFAVLIAGPIWAYEAWSRYWGWDPKEVWALITWVVYAAYLHARATAGWRGRRAAWLALVGVATLWFNFVGINYFSSTSQHSYAAPAEVTVSPVDRGTEDFVQNGSHTKS